MATGEPSRYVLGVEPELTARITELESTLQSTLRERDEYRKLYLILSEEVERLRRGLHGSKSEHIDPATPADLYQLEASAKPGCPGGPRAS